MLGKKIMPREFNKDKLGKNYDSYKSRMSEANDYFLFFIFLITSNLNSYYRLHHAVEVVALSNSNQELE